MIRQISMFAAVLGLALFNVSSVRGEDQPARASDNGNLNSHDAGFLNAISRGDVAEIKLAKLAKDRAGSDSVKSYAQHIIKDHQNAQDDLKTLAKDKGLSLATDVDDKQQAEYDRLAKLNGADFDKAYIKEMISDHEHDVDLTKDFSNHAKDADVKAFASKILPKLQDHLRMAKDVNDRLTGTGGGNR